MRRTKKWWYALVAAVVLACGALVVPLPRRQTVEITLTEGGVSSAYRTLTLISNPTGDGCADGLRGITDAEGRFVSVRHKWLPMMIDVTIDRLCIMEDDRWRVVWQVPHGPVTRRLTMKCDLAKMSPSGVGVPSPALSMKVCRVEAFER
jgi:hypothetical protein